MSPVLLLSHADPLEAAQKEQPSEVTQEGLLVDMQWELPRKAPPALAKQLAARGQEVGSPFPLAWNHLCCKSYD